MAIDHLERAWDAGQAEGLGNPNVVPFGGDLAEALARAGDKAGATAALSAVSGSRSDLAKFWLVYVQTHG